MLAASAGRQASGGDGTPPGVRGLSPLRAAGRVLLGLSASGNLLARVRPRTSAATGAGRRAPAPANSRRRRRSCRPTAPLPRASTPARDASGSTNGRSCAAPAGDRRACLRAVVTLVASGAAGSNALTRAREDLPRGMRVLPRTLAVAPGPTTLPRASRSRTTRATAPASGLLSPSILKASSPGLPPLDSPHERPRQRTGRDAPHPSGSLGIAATQHLRRDARGDPISVRTRRVDRARRGQKTAETVGRLHLATLATLAVLLPRRPAQPVRTPAARY